MTRPIRILFGTETGNAEGCAEELSDAIGAMGLPVELTDMDDYDHDDLADEALIFIVTSTFGNGDPPYNAYNFMEFIKSGDAPDLSGVAYSVCGLGDRSYPNFAQCGRDFDTRFDTLGATRVVPRVDCDVDFETPFDGWKRQVLAVVGERYAGQVTTPPPAAKGPKKKAGGFWGKMKSMFGAKDEALAPDPHESSQGQPPADAEATKPAPVPSDYTRNHPYEARILEARKLNAEGSAKETMHYVIDLGDSGIRFHGGDSFGVLPTNPPDEVAGILEATGLDPESPVRTDDGKTLALRGVLARRVCLQTTTEDFLRRIAADGGPGAEAMAAGPAAARDYLADRYVWDVLRDHDAQLDAQTLVDLLRPLPPRLYSVTSSPLIDATKVDFLVETLRYERQGRACEGVASVWLADRCADAPVPVYLVPNGNFRLPDADTDILMIGPGTGLAPFRAFLQEREKTGAKGRNWLFFGHQHEATDFLYRDELQAWQASGLLTRADYAWSRDQAEKVYVQHKLRDNGAEVWAWLQGGAHLYICGDAKGMAPGVDEALRAIAVEHGGLTAEQAKAYFKDLVHLERYHRDVY